MIWNKTDFIKFRSDADFTCNYYNTRNKTDNNRINYTLTVEYTIRRVQVNQDGLKLNGTHKLLVYVMMLINRAEAYIV